MNAFDRLLLFLYSLATAILSVMLGAHIFGFGWLNGLLDFYPYELLVGIVLLLAVSLRFLFLRSGKTREQQAISHKTELGDVRISFQTIESLTERAVRLVKGINDLKTKVRLSESGIRIAIRVTVDPDLEIPQLTSTVQQKVKDYVESTTGVTVENVVVYVSDVVKSQAGKKMPVRPRVESRVE
ncbi:alkaline shock response membrane anchor protein AmaP [Effusibacillus dendaii]|uniref:Alkaline shock response membrane anchor protein AmaP n=1 Tax=Effusibacillus dendaii TaxID=2743772 RepID=A0A7I8DAD6_9BACL|nr:alkaline shock response membrane anchor protein AmaP [Effusibacillus dendaii]BCJ85919.1 hypothetical protein skT53_09040 [Effusibacillus dendaii]